MLEERYITISDTEIFTVIKGKGFPLFVLHGGPGLDHQALGNYFDQLANFYQLIFIDLRGQGKSKEVDFETLTTSKMANDITELAEKLEYNEYGIIGHSFGAFVALQHGVDFPGIAKYIVVISGASSGKEVSEYVMENTPTLPSELLDRFNKAQVGLQNAKNHEQFLKAWGEYTSFYFSYPTNENQLSDFNTQTKNVIFRFDVLNHCAMNEYGHYDISNDLSKVTSPVLLLAGNQDNVCSLKGHKKLNKELPNSKLVVFDTGHMIFAENNARFIEEIKNFVK